MDTTLIRDINKLWLPVYPGLARQVADHCLQQPSRILEVGCCAGGGFGSHTPKAVIDPLADESRRPRHRWGLADQAQ